MDNHITEGWENLKIRNIAVVGLVLGLVCYWLGSSGMCRFFSSSDPEPKATSKISYRSRMRFDDTGGFFHARDYLKPWRDPTSLADIREAFADLGHRNIAAVDRLLADPARTPAERVQDLVFKASQFMYEGQPSEAYQVLDEARSVAKSSPELEQEWLYTIAFFQGVAGMRRGENENCLECRGEGACIFPIGSTAVHTKPEGSRLAIRHFTEYLGELPEDQAV